MSLLKGLDIGVVRWEPMKLKAEVHNGLILVLPVRETYQL